jgi:hypothetical protein
MLLAIALPELLAMSLPNLLRMALPETCRAIGALGFTPNHLVLLLFLFFGSLAGLWSNGLPLSGWAAAGIAAVPLLGVGLGMAFC